MNFTLIMRQGKWWEGNLKATSRILQSSQVLTWWLWDQGKDGGSRGRADGGSCLGWSKRSTCTRTKEPPSKSLEAHMKKLIKNAKTNVSVASRGTQSGAKWWEVWGLNTMVDEMSCRCGALDLQPRGSPGTERETQEILYTLMPVHYIEILLKCWV